MDRYSCAGTSESLSIPLDLGYGCTDIYKSRQLTIIWICYDPGNVKLLKREGLHT